MKIEQQLVDTENLLGMTRVADRECVEVIEIQFMDIACTGVWPRRVSWQS